MAVSFIGVGWAAALSIAVYVLSILAIRYATGGFGLVSPVHMYVFFYTAYVYIWTLYLFLTGQPDICGAVSLPPSDERALGVVTLAFGAFAAGSLVVVGWSNFRPRTALAAWRAVPLADDLARPASSLAIGTVVLVGSLLAVGFFVLKGFPIAAYFQAIGDPHFFKVMVEARERSLVGSGYLLQGITVTLPVASALLLARTRLGGGMGVRFLTWLIVLVLVALMFSLTSRGDFAIFLILLFLTTQAVGKRVRWTRVGLWIAAFLILFSFSSLLKLGLLEDWQGLLPAAAEAWNILLQRLALGARQMHALFQLFPHEHSFLLGRGLAWDLRSLLPGPDIGFNRWAFNLMYPATAVPSNITPTSVGEWYANFGMLGAMAMSFIIGIVLQLCHQRMVDVRRSASHVVFIMFVSTYVAKSAMNGLGAMFEPLAGALAAFAMFFVIRSVLRLAVQQDRERGVAFWAESHV